MIVDHRWVPCGVSVGRRTKSPKAFVETFGCAENFSDSKTSMFMVFLKVTPQPVACNRHDTHRSLNSCLHGYIVVYMNTTVSTMYHAKYSARYVLY